MAAAARPSTVRPRPGRPTARRASTQSGATTRAERGRICWEGRWAWSSPLRAGAAAAGGGGAGGGEGGGEAAGEEVLEGDAADGGGEEGGVEPVVGGAEADQGGGGEGVGLDAVDEEGGAVEVVAAGEVAVGGVAAAVDAGEGLFEALAGHRPFRGSGRLCRPGGRRCGECSARSPPGCLAAQEADIEAVQW
jgi:hypothetical protein